MLVRHIQKSQLVYQSFLTPKARESGLLKSETPINSPSSIIIDCVHVATCTQSIMIDDGEFIGVSDLRRPDSLALGVKND